jgi:hypothetical protein
MLDLPKNEGRQHIQSNKAIQARSTEGHSAAALLYKRCDKCVGLPDYVCTVIEQWLALPWDKEYSVFTDQELVPESTPEAEILWGPNGGLLNTDRSFWPLLCVTHGYLMRMPATTGSWYDVVEQHLSRNISERTWKAYCSELRWVTLQGADRVRGARIIAELFLRYPGVARSTEGAKLIGNVAYALPAELLQGYIDNLWRERTSWSAQAAGELLTLIALRDRSSLGLWRL